MARYAFDPAAKTAYVVTLSLLTVLAVAIGQLGLPAAAQQIQARNINVALILDRSGSMDTADKLPKAKTAAQFFVSLLQNGDQLTVAAFNEVGTLVSALTSIPSEAPDDSVKQDLKSKIDALTGSGSSNFSQGLQIALDELKKATAARRTCAILLSDGNRSPSSFDSQIQEFKRLNWPIYAISFGAAANTAVLQQIAGDTGGLFFDATQDSLVFIFSRVQAGCRGSSVASSSSGTIVQGLTILQDVPLFDSTITLAQFQLAWDGSDLDLKLIKPDGTEIGPAEANADPNMKHAATSISERYTVKNPQPGLWQMMIIGVDVANPEPFATSVLIENSSVVFANFSNFKSRSDVGSSVDIMVILRDVILPEGAQPIKSATVIATVIKPNATQVALTLLDDGTHNDGKANDGLYGARLAATETTLTGIYTIRIVATGMASTGAFTKNIEGRMQVGVIPPTVNSVTPKRGVLGQTLNVTISGRNFTGATAVGFGAGITVNSFNINSDTQITANITISATATLGARDVTVLNAAGTGTGTGLFTVQPLLITAVNPPSGAQGETLSVMITGSKFTGATEVNFGLGIAVNSFTVNSDTQITANITISSSAALGARDVSVKTAAGTGTEKALFAVAQLPPPTITSVNPNSGKPGENLTITLTGKYFLGATTVDFGSGITINVKTVDSATQIRVAISISQSATLGSRDVKVTNAAGTGTLTGGFAVTSPPFPSDITVLTNIQRCTNGRAFKLLLLRNERGNTGDVTISSIAASGSGWSSFTLVAGTGLLRDGGIKPIRAQGSCTSDQLAVTVTLSTGAVHTTELEERALGGELKLSLEGGLLLVRTSESQVSKLTVQIFTLRGQEVFKAQALGHRLAVIVRDKAGRPLANGVYLVIISMERADGSVVRQIRKLAVLR